MAKGVIEMKVVKKWLAVFFCLMLGGCAPVFFFGAGTAVGVMGYKYYKGALTVRYEAPYILTWDASLKAAKQMGFKIERSEHDLTEGEIVARRADKKPVTIFLEYKSPKETRVVIRVGYLGEKGAAARVEERIRANLFET